ncbi:MAG: phytanoyl-CoA dioxygenase family protein [Caldilineaceae bacterium]|nr:phytanoyl-CoA dioxygenase family protein [Caldilineaceae bacterium]
MRAPAVADGTKVSMSGHELVFGQNIFTPRDANGILHDEAALHARIEEDGYLLIRGFYDREAVLSARTDILKQLSEQGRLAKDVPMEKGTVGQEGGNAVLPHDDVLKMPSYLRLVNSRRIMAFFERFLGGPVLTLDHKWPRAVSTGVSTGAHYDVVFMGAGTKQLYTAWTPLDDISLTMGPLAFCPGSNRLDILRSTYGSADAHNDLLDGHLSRDPHDLIESLGVQWASTPFRAGDVMIFGMFFLHGSLDNVSDRYRISTDTRYQLASEPVDERHMGPHPGNIPKAENRKTMAEMREVWGI